MTDAPLLVRLAGLDASTLELFRDPAASDLVEAIGALDGELDAARAELVDRLHEAVPGIPAERRGGVLKIKRDAFNGRRLGAGAADRLAREGIEEITVRRVVELEEGRAALASELESTHRRILLDQRRGLVELAAIPEIRRALALAAPDLFDGVARFERGELVERKARKLESGLARYLSRAAAKLSPYSTFTPVGLATLEAGLDAPHLETASRADSLVRVKRYLLRQVLDVLTLCPTFRDSLPIELNNTVEEIAPGRLRFLRPGRWRRSGENGRVRYERDALVEVELGGPLIEALRRLARTGEGGRVLPELVESLRMELAAEADPASAREQVSAMVLRLLDLSFLLAVPPWPVNIGHLETALLEHLRGLGSPLGEVTDVLAELVALETGYAASADPVGAARRIDAALDALWQATARVAGLGETDAYRAPKGNFYEDVFLSTAPASPAGGAMARMPRARAAEMVAWTRPLVSILGLSRPAHALGHLVDAFLAERWPERREIGLLELFSGFQPVWEDFLRIEARQGARRTVDPLGLPELDALEALRVRLWDRLLELCAPFDEEFGAHRLDPAALAALAEQIPPRYRSQVGGALHVQPAGELWVLNRMAEGIGRLGSRFTPSMPGELAALWSTSMAARSGWTECRAADPGGEGGERLELLDLMCIGGDTLNVHAAQTRRALELPGEPSSVAAEGRVSLAELRVRRTALGPRVVDGRGRGLLPVHLGVAAHLYMPSLIKFLSALGPGALSHPFPSPPGREAAPGVRCWERLVLGDLVLQRRAWRFAPAALPELDGLGDAAAFAAIEGWRRRHGLPSRLFLAERLVLGKVVRRKPQFLDLRSPICVRILCRAMQGAGETAGVRVEEMLPTPEMAPRAADGSARAAEWVVDALALAPPDDAADDDFISSSPPVAERFANPESATAPTL